LAFPQRTSAPGVGVEFDGVGSDGVGCDGVGSDSVGPDGVGCVGVGPDDVGSDVVGCVGVGSDGVGSDGVGQQRSISFDADVPFSVLGTRVIVPATAGVAITKISARFTSRPFVPRQKPLLWGKPI
jgi:hypothetical protein